MGFTQTAPHVCTIHAKASADVKVNKVHCKEETLPSSINDWRDRSRSRIVGAAESLSHEDRVFGYPENGSRTRAVAFAPKSVGRREDDSCRRFNLFFRPAGTIVLQRLSWIPSASHSWCLTGACVSFPRAA